MKCDFFEFVEGDTLVDSYVQANFTIEERNLLAYVCAVDGVPLQKKFADLVDTILSMAKLSLTFTGLSLRDAVKEWNQSTVVCSDPSRAVMLFGE